MQLLTSKGPSATVEEEQHGLLVSPLEAAGRTVDIQLVSGEEAVVKIEVTRSKGKQPVETHLQDVWK